MWSHYADSHRGICLEFDNHFEPFSKAKKVIYDEVIPTIETDSLFLNDIDNQTIDKYLVYKSVDWEYEKELRILHKESKKNFSYPNHALKAIYFGIKANQSDIEIICSIVKSHNPQVKFYQMIKLGNTFSMEPEEFFYQTVMEVQTRLIRIVKGNFSHEGFKLDELFAEQNIGITREQLQSHLEDLIDKKVVFKIDSLYSLNH